MPKVCTHLHLALKLFSKLDIKDKDSFYLGSAYPDFWNTSMSKSRNAHYKKGFKSICDLDAFLKDHELSDEFNLAYYFHLWVDNYATELDTEDISKYDAIICDMEIVSSIIEDLRNKTFSGLKKEALDNILELKNEALPLYLVSEEKKQKYNDLLDQIVLNFLTHYLKN